MATSTVTPTRTASATPTATPPGAPATATLGPVADAYVDDGSPGTNYGASTRLKVDAFPIDVAYVKFDLGPLAGRTVSSAVLRIRVATDTGAGSADTQNVRVVEDSSWAESGITYGNRPVLSSGVIGSLANTVANTSYDVALDPAAIQAKVGRVLSLGLDSPGSDGLVLYSRESANPPQLIIAYR
jgi:hypothetical protein